METLSESESLEFDDADEGEHELELDAIQDFQTAADASSHVQHVGAATVVISAEYSTWRGKASFQQAYTVVSSPGRRRLTDGSFLDDLRYKFDELGGASVGGAVDVTSESKQRFVIDLGVSTKR